MIPSHGLVEKVSGISGLLSFTYFQWTPVADGYFLE